MDYIDAKQFLEQLEEVWRVFQDWWLQNKQHGDIYFEPAISIDENLKSNVLIKDTIMFPDYYMYKPNQIRCLGCYPALSETQLRKFIEEKMNGTIDIVYENKLNNSWEITLICWPYLQDEGFGECEEYKVQVKDLLQAYWKVACEIAKEVK